MKAFSGDVFQVFDRSGRMVSGRKESMNVIAADAQKEDQFLSFAYV